MSKRSESKIVTIDHQKYPLFKQNLQHTKKKKQERVISTKEIKQSIRTDSLQRNETPAKALL